MNDSKLIYNKIEDMLSQIIKSDSRLIGIDCEDYYKSISNQVLL